MKSTENAFVFFSIIMFLVVLTFVMDEAIYERLSSSESSFEERQGLCQFLKSSRTKQSFDEGLFSTYCKRILEQGGGKG